MLDEEPKLHNWVYKGRVSGTDFNERKFEWICSNCGHKFYTNGSSRPTDEFNPYCDFTKIEEVTNL